MPTKPATSDELAKLTTALQACGAAMIGSSYVDEVSLVYDPRERRVVALFWRDYQQLRERADVHTCEPWVRWHQLRGSDPE